MADKEEVLSDEELASLLKEYITMENYSVLIERKDMDMKIVYSRDLKSSDRVEILANILAGVPKYSRKEVIALSLFLLETIESSEEYRGTLN